MFVAEWLQRCHYVSSTVNRNESLTYMNTSNPKVPFKQVPDGKTFDYKPPCGSCATVSGVKRISLSPDKTASVAILPGEGLKPNAIVLGAYACIGDDVMVEVIA